MSLKSHGGIAEEGSELRGCSFASLLLHHQRGTINQLKLLERVCLVSETLVRGNKTCEPFQPNSTAFPNTKVKNKIKANPNTQYASAHHNLPSATMHL